jgi:hypothetical protein
MPTDLRDLYAALSADTDATILDTAASVRRRADRHALNVVVAACVGVAVAVGGVAIVANGALSGHKAPTPADSPSPVESPVSPAPSLSPSPSPTSSPSSLPSQQIVPPANAPIPDSAFFTPPANRTKIQPYMPTDGRRVDRPSLCGAMYPSDARIGRERSRHIFYSSVNAPPDYVPLGTVDQTISVYEPGGAEAAMSEIRAAVIACPSEKADNGGTAKYRLLTPKDTGDDVILIEETWTPPPSDSPPYPSVTKQLYYFVRIGDVLTELFVTGWEDIDADRSVGDDYTNRAVRAIERWRQ